MDICKFAVGEHYRYRGQTFQIVDVADDVVQLRALEGQKIVIRQTVRTLAQAMKRGDLIKKQEALIDPQKILAGLPNTYTAAFDRKWHYVQGLMDRFYGRMPKSGSCQAISELAKQINDVSQPSFSTARGWMRVFRRSGFSVIALVPTKRKKIKHRLLQQPHEFQQIITQLVSTLYMQKEPACKTEVIDAIRLELQAFNDSRPEPDQLKIPSESTLNRILREQDAYNRAVAQKGQKYAQKHQGWTRKRPRSARLYELVEADTQEMHVMVVDDDGQVVGRPYLTVFLEVSSRMPTAWTIGFNPPSLDTTLKALKLSISSENAYGGVAERYVFDSGSEFVGKNLQRIIAMMGGEICYCEPGTGNQKPHVEAFFGTWSKEIAHVMPGTTFSSIAARGAYNSEKHAALRLPDVLDIFGRWVKDVYCERIHSSLNTSPRLAWEAGQQAMFPPKRHSTSELHQHFLRAFKASPQQGRLRHNSLFWTGPAVAYLANREPKVEKLLVYYDPSDLGTAWASHPDYPEEVLELQAVDPDYQSGLTMHMHQLTLKRLREQRKRFDSNIARRARTEILRDLAKLKTSAQRRKHQQSAEKGSLSIRKEREAGASLVNPRKPDKYHFHDDAPDDDVDV